MCIRDRHKRGDYITIEPNNNYKGYSKGFLYAPDIIEGFEYGLRLVYMHHFNTWIYSARFRLV